MKSKILVVSGALLGLNIAGMDMSAVHDNMIKNPHNTVLDCMDEAHRVEQARHEYIQAQRLCIGAAAPYLPEVDFSHFANRTESTICGKSIYCKVAEQWHVVPGAQELVFCEAWKKPGESFSEGVVTFKAITIDSLLALNGIAGSCRTLSVSAIETFLAAKMRLKIHKAIRGDNGDVVCLMAMEGEMATQLWDRKLPKELESAKLVSQVTESSLRTLLNAVRSINARQSRIEQDAINALHADRTATEGLRRSSWANRRDVVSAYFELEE